MYTYMLTYVLAFEKPKEAEAVVVDQIELVHACSLLGCPMGSLT